MEITRRLALLIPQNQEGRVLLQHRTPNAPIKPNYWAFFGGHIENNESPEQAAIREFKEELLINIEKLTFFKKFLFPEKDGFVEKHFFTFPLNEPEGKLKLQQQEGQNLGFFSLAEANKLKVHPDDLSVLTKFFQKLS